MRWRWEKKAGKLSRTDVASMMAVLVSWQRRQRRGWQLSQNTMFAHCFGRSCWLTLPRGLGQDNTLRLSRSESLAPSARASYSRGRRVRVRACHASVRSVRVRCVYATRACACVCAPQLLHHVFSALLWPLNVVSGRGVFFMAVYLTYEADETPLPLACTMCGFSRPFA
eukprot:6191007-Pleurochrysis_carterae.AAC.2